jgi:hypothetical protein
MMIKMALAQPAYRSTRMMRQSKDTSTNLPVQVGKVVVYHSGSTKYLNTMESGK